MINQNSPSLARRDFIKTIGAASAAMAAVPAISLAQQAPKTITVAFVGCAHIHTPEFVGVVKKRPDVKVKAVWDHDKARAERRAKEMNTKTVDDAKEIWSDPEINAVIICAETNRHRELVLAAAEAKKHLFVEKPLGFTAEESYSMADAVEKNKLLFATGYFMRSDPKNLFLKEQVANGAFGKITRVRGSNCHSGSLGRWFDTEWRWMADPKIAGVGGFGDLGTHSLDILMWLFGDVDSITADIKVVVGNYGDCDEAGEALIRFKNGITGSLAAGWVDVENPVPLEICGTEGHAVIVKNDLFFSSKKVEGAKSNTPWTKFPDPLPRPMHLFLNAVGGVPNQPLVTIREAAARVAVMEAAYKAAKNQSWVKPA